jgi:RNA polymerase sigma-70 factor, ECF subfamily
MVVTGLTRDARDPASNVQTVVPYFIRSDLFTMTRNAFGQAYQTGFDRTVRFLTSRGAPRDGAMEAAQAAWVRGWERLSQLRNEDMILTWVNTIALNVYRGVARRQSLSQPLPELHSKFQVNISAIDADRVLKFCRPSERALLEQQMRGVTTEEIARDNGVTETAIRIRLMRARRAVRTQMETRAAQLRMRDRLEQREAA